MNKQRQELLSAASRLTWTDLPIVQSVMNDSSTKLYNQESVQGTRVAESIPAVYFMMTSVSQKYFQKMQLSSLLFRFSVIKY